jgi:transposase
VNDNDKKRNKNFHRDKSRQLHQSKSNLKLEALARWKAGESITQISQELGISRDSIYRWSKAADAYLAKALPKRSSSIDRETKDKILELYFLLKRPSMNELSQALKHHFSLQIPAFSLRRYIKKWGLFDYQPTRFFEIILLEQGWRRVALDNAVDED